MPDRIDIYGVASSKHPLYNTWAKIKSRCYSKKDKRYIDYGGRGIKVCDRWLTSFKNFVDDMGPRPNGMSIDRVDNDGDYTPENCKWSTPTEQNNNKRVEKPNAVHKDNVTGHKGIGYCKKREKFRVRVYDRSLKKDLHVGYYETLNAAISARNLAHEP